VTDIATSTARVNRWVDDAWAERYLADRPSYEFMDHGVAVLQELLAGREVTRVLDLGTGDGRTLALVLEMFPSASGVGVDFNAGMLRRAGERFDGDARVELLRHDLDEPLPELGRFDAIVSSFAIHHCAPERQRTLYAEVYGRLTPGGIFVNLEHVASPTPERHVEFLTAIGKTPEQDDPSNQLAPVADHLSWLDEHGFTQVECLWKWREIALLTGVRD
jgi:SAM-dependent methyltransferase